jgi:hypothetical protein
VYARLNINMKCEYGCNNEAKFLTKQGRNICCKSSTQCPVNRAKNSNGLKQCYATNQRSTVFATSHEAGNLARANSILTKQREQVQRFINGESNTLANSAIKRLLLREYYVEDKCIECGNNEWRGKKLNLELDHIDGDNFNNSLENLRLLCPNCHSITDSYCGKNKNTGKIKVSDEILLAALKKEPNIRQALISVRLSPKGGNYTRAVKLLNREH